MLKNHNHDLVKQLSETSSSLWRMKEYKDNSKGCEHCMNLWEGVEGYYSLISEADELGVEVIGDVKRGDIGHTAKCYAEAHLQNPELAGLEDIITPDEE